MRRRIELSIHGKLYFVLVIFVGMNLSIAEITSDGVTQPRIHACKKMVKIRRLNISSFYRNFKLIQNIMLTYTASADLTNIYLLL